MFSATIDCPSVRATPSREQARHHVCRAAGTGRNNELDGPTRPRLRKRLRMERQEGEADQDAIKSLHKVTHP
jgi:hypothetical protein